MIFKIRKASSSYADLDERIVINTLEDLKKIDDENDNCGLIVEFVSYDDEEADGHITIYDDYVE